MHACMHTHIHAHIRTCVHAYTHTHILACVHAYIHAHIRTCVHTSTCAYSHTRLPDQVRDARIDAEWMAETNVSYLDYCQQLRELVRTDVPSYIYACIRTTCMHACVHACMHAYIHTYMHAYIQVVPDVPSFSHAEAALLARYNLSVWQGAAARTAAGGAKRFCCPDPSHASGVLVNGLTIAVWCDDVH